VAIHSVLSLARADRIFVETKRRSRAKAIFDFFNFVQVSVNVGDIKPVHAKIFQLMKRLVIIKREESVLGRRS
jgi:CRISPR/Cas system-associated endoribonuclease Cas2